MYFDAIRMPSDLQRVEIFGEDRSDCSALFHCSTYDSDNDFARFGFVCSMLEMIPLIGQAVFPLTNACAAGLFACDIEAMGGPVSMRPPDAELPPKPEDTTMVGKVKATINANSGNIASSMDTAKKLYNVSKAKGKTGKIKALCEVSKTTNMGSNDGADYHRHES